MSRAGLLGATGAFGDRQQVVGINLAFPIRDRPRRRCPSLGRQLSGIVPRVKHVRCHAGLHRPLSRGQAGLGCSVIHEPKGKGPREGVNGLL